MPATKQLLCFDIDSYHFGVSIKCVDRVVPAVEVTPLPDAPDAIMGLINVHGVITPVLNIRKRLGLADRPIAVSDYFVIASVEEKPLALPVDSVEGLIEYADDQLVSTDKILTESSSAKVIRILDGLLVLCEPNELLNESERKVLAVALERAAT